MYICIYIYIYIYIYAYIVQTGFSCRGSGGFGKRASVPGWLPGGESAHTVAVSMRSEWMVLSKTLSDTVNIGNFLQNPLVFRSTIDVSHFPPILGHPCHGLQNASQVFPKWFPNVSQMGPKSVPNVSQMVFRCDDDMMINMMI